MANQTKKEREAAEAAAEAAAAAAAAEAAAAAAAAEEDTGESDDPLEGLSDEGAQSFVDDLLQKASDLEDERQDLMTRTAATRDTLRTIKTTGLLSERQAAAIDLWYPPRVRRTAEPTEAAA